MSSNTTLMDLDELDRTYPVGTVVRIHGSERTLMPAADHVASHSGRRQWGERVARTHGAFFHYEGGTFCAIRSAINVRGDGTNCPVDAIGQIVRLPEPPRPLDADSPLADLERRFPVGARLRIHSRNRTLMSAEERIAQGSHLPADEITDVAGPFFEWHGARYVAVRSGATGHVGDVGVGSLFSPDTEYISCGRTR